MEDINEYKLNNNNTFVIVVDDDEFLLNNLSNRLLKKEIKNIKCNDGLKCFEKIKEINNKLNNECQIVILSDIDMPKMNGLEMAKEINDYYINNNIDFKNISIIYISSDIVNNKLNDKYKNFDINFPFIKFFYSKPINNKTLDFIIQQFLH